MGVSIWWIRRDLRVADNQALVAAHEGGRTPIPVFIQDPKLWSEDVSGHKRLAFLAGCLECLDKELRARGSRLYLRGGDPQHALANLVSETDAEEICAEADHSPFARNRDAKIADQLPLRLTNGLTVLHPGSVLKADGTPYRVFTPFSKKWRETVFAQSLQVRQAPDHLPKPKQLRSEPLPEADPQLFAPGESSAQERLRLFTHGNTPPIYEYARDRDRMDLEATSSLSPYLRFGTLSAAQAVRAAQAAIERAPDHAGREGAATWLTELIWREFYVHILFHYPQVLRSAFRSEMDQLQWKNDPQDLEAWRQGLTGYPVVDAAMRQMNSTGWMHNRARMIVASFLVKDLLVDWRYGERWFMQQLIDGDPAANNGGWQWVAGTGTDAAPYFRVFNPTTQGKRFDPSGDFVRKWIPELGQVPAEHIHEPHRMSAELQAKYGVRIGEDYPLPIVDHSQARERALATYGRVKNADRES